MSNRRSFGRCYQKKRRDGTTYDGWYVRYVEGGTRVERGGFTTKDGAETFLAGRRLERGQRRAVGLPDLRRVALRVAVDEYLVHLAERRRPSTVSATTTHLRVMADRVERDVLDLSQDDVRRHIEYLRREKDYAPATLHLVRVLVSGFLRWAIERRYARENVARGLAGGLPRIDHEAPPYLAPEDLRVIYAAIPADVRAIAILCGEAGLRRNEAVELRHGEVARDRRSVTIRGARSKGHRARTIPLTTTARDALVAILGKKAVRMDAEARVFGVERSQFQREFSASMRKIGRTDVTPRTLRHAFGSGAAMAGVDLEIIRRLMGHRSITTTMIYACHRPRGAEEQAIRALEAHRASPSASQRRKAT